MRLDTMAGPSDTIRAQRSPGRPPSPPTKRPTVRGGPTSPGVTRRGFLTMAGAAFGALATSAPVRHRASARGRFPGADDVGADIATRWFDRALHLVQVTPGFSPPVTSRAFGCAGVALYEALVPGMAAHQSLAHILPGLGPLPAAGRNTAYDWELVTNAACGFMLSQLCSTAPADVRASIARMERSIEARLRRGLPPGMANRSVGRGRAVATAVWDWAKRDGGHEAQLDNFPPYDPPAGPSSWVPTPPGHLPGLHPYWGSNRCFALRSGAACPPGDHTPYAEGPTSSFHREALEVYDAVNNATPEQTAIAQFWSDDPGQSPTPPGHSVSIATQVLEREDASLATAAETYARVGLAVADAFIACWYQKYRYHLLRPVTYVHRFGDRDWLPILVTPPFPEYPSGHSVQSGAAFDVLTHLFGDGYAFTDHTHDARGMPARTFRSFHHAAEEAAISRLYGGIHFRPAIDNGLVQGSCVAEAINSLPLRRDDRTSSRN